MGYKNFSSVEDKLDSRSKTGIYFDTTKNFCLNCKNKEINLDKKFCTDCHRIIKKYNPKRLKNVSKCR